MISMSPSSRNWIVFLVGLLVSILSIVLPLIGLWADYRPELMTGAVIGATVRFSTDLGLMALAGGSVEDLSDYSRSRLPIVLGLILAQMATLGVGVYLALTGPVLLGLGIVGAMLLAYATGIILSLFTVEPNVVGSADDGSDSEWAVDVDDV